MRHICASRRNGARELARECPHLPTAHELEAIGVELMQKAAELDHLQEDRDAEQSTRE